MPMTYSAGQIRKLRRRLNISQNVLAGVLNTNVSTVRKWEQGERRPGGSSLRLLNLLDRKGIEALL
jgi:putative transcriptional regulator